MAAAIQAAVSRAGVTAGTLTQAVLPIHVGMDVTTGALNTERAVAMAIPVIAGLRTGAAVTAAGRMKGTVSRAHLLPVSSGRGEMSSGRAIPGRKAAAVSNRTVTGSNRTAIAPGDRTAVTEMSAKRFSRGGRLSTARLADREAKRLRTVTRIGATVSARSGRSSLIQNIATRSGWLIRRNTLIRMSPSV